MKRLILPLLLAALGVGRVQADQTVVLKASAGLGGLCRPGRWTPVRIDVDVRGDTAAGEVSSGEIIVEWGDARVRRALSVVSPSRKQIELYVRTPDARDSMKVRLESNGREIAVTEAPVRLVAPADPLTLCVATPNAAPPNGVTCSATVNPTALPHSWRGYGAADDVVWSLDDAPTFTGEQKTALEQWRGVQAIENAETSSPSIDATEPPAHALRRTNTTMLLYAAALGVCVWPFNRIRSRSLVVYPIITALVVAGALVAVGAGRMGSSATVQVAQAAVVQQLPGAKGAFVLARGVAEFPSLGAVEMKAARAEGAIAMRGGSDRRDLRFDENGAPLVAGTFGLGSTAAFDVEAVTPFEALRADSHGETVRVSNISTQRLRDCRFGAGFSRAAVGAIAPGQGVEAVREGGPREDLFTCALDAPIVEFIESRRPVVSHGSAVIVLRLPEGRAKS